MKRCDRTFETPHPGPFWRRQHVEERWPVAPHITQVRSEVDTHPVEQSTRPDHPNPEHRPDRALRSVGGYNPLGPHGGSPAACTIDDCRHYDIVVLYEFDNLLSEPEVGNAMGPGRLQ